MIQAKLGKDSPGAPRPWSNGSYWREPIRAIPCPPSKAWVQTTSRDSALPSGPFNLWDSVAKLDNPPNFILSAATAKQPPSWLKLIQSSRSGWKSWIASLRFVKSPPIVPQLLISLLMRPTFDASTRHWSQLERDWLVSHAINYHPLNLPLLTLCLP